MPAYESLSSRYIIPFRSSPQLTSLSQGDRDYRCNWLAIQRMLTRLNLNCYTDHFSPRSLDMTKAQKFTIANSTRSTYGETLEYGKLSFTLIRGAGHCVEGYEARVAFEHFGRVVGHLPVADGRVEGRGADGKWFERNQGGDCNG